MIPALIGAAAAIGGSLMRNRAIKKQISAQSSENERVRQYNSALASRQNQWNIDQWNRENAYNTPAAQMARMKAAGLNPDLAYGQQNLAAASPEMTAGEASPVQDMSAIGQKSTIGDAMMQFNQSRLIEAQAKLAESQANKTDAETEGQKSTNKILESDANFRDAINSGTVELNNMSLKVSGKGLQLTDAQITKLRKDCQQIDQSIEQSRATIDEIRQKISNLQTDQAISRLRYILDAKIGEATIKKMASEYGLNYISAKQIIDKLPYEIANIQASTSKTRVDTTVALDSLDTAAVTRSVLSGQALQLSIKNAWNQSYLDSVMSESALAREILIRCNKWVQ